MYARNQIADVLKKFQILDTDIQHIREAGKYLVPKLDECIESFYVWLKGNKEYQVFFGNNNNKQDRVIALQKVHWETFFEAKLDENFFQSRMHIGEVHAHIDLPNDIYFAGVAMLSQAFIQTLHSVKPAPKNANAMADAMMKLIFLDTFIVIEEISRIQKEKITASSNALMELSTPVTPIWEGILLLPLLGIVDSTRTQDIMNKTLSEIAKTRAKVFVMDISGVGAMDTGVANQLIKITKATQLMGCETIISGLSPSIATTLVELGVNIGEVKTTSTLRDSFEIALKTVGQNKTNFGD